MNYYYLSIIIIVLALVINGYITSGHMTSGYMTNAQKKEQFQINIPVNFPNDFNFTNDYLSMFNSGDIQARNLNGNIEEVYANSVVVPSITQKNICQNIVDTLLETVNKDKHRTFLKTPWNIVLFRNIENNFPHTHEDVILYPLNKVENDENSQITFVHEKAHVFQKRNPEVFEDLYMNYWGFKKTNISQGNISFDIRSNPDTPNLHWTFQDCVLLVKYNPNPKNLNDVSYVAYNPETKETIELRKWKPFVDYFGQGNINYYHPDEISATMISNYCFDYNESTPGFKQMVKWYGTIN